MKRMRIGEIFVDAGLISIAELSQVLSENQKYPGEKLGSTLVRLQLATETEVARALSFQLRHLSRSLSFL